MSTERFYGAEIVEIDQGGEFVQERKAATCFLIGTAPIHEVHATAEERAAYINKKIIIRRQSDIAKHFGPHRAGYTLPQKLNAMFKKAKTKGIGTICVVNVFDPDVHKDGGDNPDPSLVTASDIVGTFDAAGTPTGLKLAYSCYQAFGWFAKMILATGFDQLVGVKAEMASIAAKTRARYFLDAPYGVSVQDVVTARGAGGDFDFQTSDTRAVLCWPNMLILDEDPDSTTTGTKIPDPYSAHLAGIWLMSIMEWGYHHSPSNREIIGTEGMAQEVLYVPGDASSDVQTLRSNGIVSAEERHGKGPHTSGNHSAAHPTSTKMQTALYVQLTEDMMHEAILHFLDEWKDRLSSPEQLELVEDIINKWGLGKTVGRDRALLGFRFSFDRQKTTTATVAEHHYFYKLKYMPVGMMEWLTVESEIDTDLARDPLGLAA
ncbi:phage tail protein [Maritalea porphyrae]|uniref:phage tail protein n=1 Tax=Maritalea porphyrae TaxID=880732 RepID=UPI0022AF0E4C|nr:phage tail protein [Maritalea porphyrae]MCZ4273304.1 phage tail protein [Maritalea porphyrae]